MVAPNLTEANLTPPLVSVEVPPPVSSGELVLLVLHAILKENTKYPKKSNY